MPLTVTNMQLYTRQRYLDTDTTTPAVTDAELLKFQNRNYIWFRTIFSPRLMAENYIALGSTLDQGEMNLFLTPANIAEVKRVFRRTTTGTVTVSSDVSTGTTAATTSGTFASVLPGMTATHANLPTGTYVTQVASTTALTLSDKATSDIVGSNIVFRATTGVPMRQDDYNRILSLQQLETVQAPPILYGIRRARAATVDSVGYMEFAVWPIPDVTYYFPMLLRYETTELSAGTDKPDVQDGEAYTICDMSAAMAARLLGRDSIADSILAELPPPIRSYMGQALKTIQPRTSRVETPVA